MAGRVPMYRGLLVLTLLGLLVRAAFLSLEPPVDRRGDEPSWIGTAVRGLVRIHTPLSPWSPRILFYPPLYPYVLAASYHFTGGLGAIPWLQVGVSSLLIPAVGFIGASAFSRRAGLFAAAAIAFYPDLVWFAAHFWSETFFLTFLSWGIERALLADAAEAGDAALASGALLGFAALTRDLALPFAVLAAVWMAWPRGSERPRARKTRGALLLLGTLLVVGPWSVRNWMVFRAFIPVSTFGALNLWVGNSDLDRDEVYRLSDSVEGPVAQYRLAREQALADIFRRQPQWVFEKAVSELPRLLAVSSEEVVFVEGGAYGPEGVAWVPLVRFVSGVPWVLLAALGAPALVLLRATRPRGLLLVFLVYYVGVHIMVFGHHRFHLPLVPVLAPWACGLFLEEPPADPWRAPAAAALALAVVLCLVSSLLPAGQSWP